MMELNSMNVNKQCMKKINSPNPVLASGSIGFNAYQRVTRKNYLDRQI